MRKFLLLTVLLFSAFISKAQLVDEKDKAISEQLVRANKDVLGLSADEASNLMVHTAYQIPGTDMRMAYMQQTHMGIPVINRVLSLAFRNGKVVSSAGEVIEEMATRTENNSGVPTITASDALMTAFADRKVKIESVPESSAKSGNGNKLEFGKMGISKENVTAELLWFPMEGNEKDVRLVWQIFVAPANSSDYWLVRVDANRNQVVGIYNLTVYCDWGAEGHSIEEHTEKHFDPWKEENYVVQKNNNKKNWQYRPFVVNNATYRVVRHPAESPIHPGGTPALHANPWTWAPGNATTLGWHTSDNINFYDSTRGNNVFAYEDRDNNNLPGFSGLSTTPQPDLTFDFAPNFASPPTQRSPAPNQQFNTTNLFYWNNLIHDVSYVYGFTEAARNFQTNNLGRGGAQNDHVLAEAQDGSGTNNANFATPADGGSGRMQMFLWTSTNPQRDGDVDNGIILHEYTHGISNRLTGTGSGCLSTIEQAGEGWSDYYTLMLSHDWATALPGDGFSKPRGIGTYALGEPITGVGIRPTQYTTNMAINPSTYANLAAVAAPHGVGYLWCTALWDMTWEIIQTAGISPNIFDPTATGGNVIALKLVQEGLRLQPCGPGFITARNAILRADTLFYGAQYSCAIIKAFARRGMGIGASQGSPSTRGDEVLSFNTGGPSLTVNANLIQALELQNITYTNTVTAGLCDPIVGWTLTDTLPLHVTYVSGGSYNPSNRVVSFSPITIPSGSPQTFQFTVNVNAGSYFAPTNILNENVDGVTAPTIPAGWTATTTNATSFWRSSTTSARSAPNAFFVNNIAALADVRLVSSVITPTLPQEGYNILSFWHRYVSENGFDGGVVEISTNGGSTWSDLGPYMILNGYNRSLNASTNPLSGRQVFSGNSGAAFIETRVNLASFSGQSIMIRFRFGSDPTVASTGWFVDDITLGNLPLVLMKSNLYNASNVLQVQAANAIEIINVCTAPAITTQPRSNVLCAGANASFAVVATGNGLMYQWEVSTDNGASWSSIAAANAATYSITGPTSALNGRLYRCVISGTCGTITSNPATLYVSSALTHTGVAAAPTTVCTPASATITGTANGGTVTNAVVASSGLLNLPVPDNNPAGLSSSVTLPAINFAAASNLKVQVVTNSGHSWVGDLIVTLTSPCGTTLALHRPGVPQTTFGNDADFDGTYVFDLAAATIVPETGGGVIAPGSYQPSNDDVAGGISHPWTGITFPCSGAGTWTLNVSDNAGGDVGTLESWALVIGGGYTHTLTGPGTIVQNAPGGVNNQTGNFTVTGAPVGNNNYVFTSRDVLGCSVSSNVLLTTSAPPVITVQPVSRVICQGTNTTFNVTATGINLTYQWQLSTNVGGTWNDIPGQTTNSTAITAATLIQSGHQYRCIVTSGCGSVTSNSETLTVTPNPIHTSLTVAPNPVCVPGPSSLSGTAVGGTIVSGANDVVIASSGAINLAIPSSTTVTNNLTVPAYSYTSAANLKVRLNINHTWVGDLRIQVTTPCGTTVLFDRPGVPPLAAGNSDNLGTSTGTTPPPGVYIFDIGAGTVIPETNVGTGFIAPGSYRPSDINGAPQNWTGLTFPCSAAGTWTISIQDNAAGDQGNLVDWAILGPGPVVAGLYTHTMTGPFTITQNASTGGPTNPTGNFTVSNLGAGTQTYNLTTTDSRGCSVTSPISLNVIARPSTTILPATTNLCNGSSVQLGVLDTTKTLSSTVPIIIPTVVGVANPYPGTLAVSGLPAFARVRSVTLTGLSHTTVGDIDVLLQSPNGTNVILMSDRGGNNPVVNVNYTFQDGSPILPAVAGPSGTYAPTNTAGPDNFPAPGPGTITQVTPTIALFNNANLVVNGTWNLYVADLNDGDGGSITSWSITFDVPGSQLVTYTWSPATGLSSTTGNPVTASPTLAQLSPATSIVYSVSAVNTSTGCTSAAPGTATVNVLALPAITTQPLPASQTICPGFNVSYSVVATGAGITYQWRKNGTPLVNGGNVSGATSATLTLSAVAAADAGTYSVVITGTCTPAVTSSDAVLQIGNLPTITTQPPATTTVCERYTTTISVTATALPPIQIYKWQTSTDNITFTDLTNSAAGSSPFYNNVFSSTLTIGNAPLSISGRYYRCIITTACNFSITSGSSRLTVNPTPVVSAVPITARVCYSDTLVTLSGSPVGGVWSGPGVSPGTNLFLPYNAAVGTFPVKYKVTTAGCSDSAIINIRVEDCGERIRLLRNDGVLLYPNPNNGQFNLRVNSTLYNYLGMKIYTSTGQLVKQQNWSNLPYGRVIPIDIRHLPAAVYMVYVYYDDGVRTSEKTFKVVVPAH
jgi:subtilisin-like proprotein convertase family protein